ncbi:RluA family pseudouridine synthase [Oceanobacillus alkalisoli]|uniref:RluA family pseudouridine synthase n=1 Tax=Oceanobacillus alkalisoli TaxID=2925113 RepID=UPI001EE3B980|nr:RluA family pseudouridine synthase [Oceanobacillus alkalisoli]MCG5105052.1 RluA family pseudouridine synthase [Oceanobacillus alkalisoli]
MKWTIKNEQAGMLIRDFLQQVGGFSRRILIAAKSDEGNILLNEVRETVRAQLKAGDILEVQLPPEPVSKWLFPEQLDLTIEYEDEAVLVINKPPGMPTLPSPKYKSGTVANGVLAHYEKIGNPHTIHIVTRLDKDTSGLLLIAKDRLSHSLLAKSQQRFTINRKYMTIVEGHMDRKEGKIDAPIGRNPASIVERMVTDTGKRAVTHYKLKKRLAEHTLVEVELETGRTHQIRVHFSYLNHPLLGDDLYGGKKDSLNRQALHCHEIRFLHPFTGKALTVVTDLPEDMVKAMNQLSSD